jgi:hypothetical protein
VIGKINVKVHIRGPAHWTLDSTPQVLDREYCRKIGFTDGRTFCPVRMEGATDRKACEEYAVGRADDTDRPGPTWYYNNSLCDGTHCQNHPDNQYLLWITTIPGTYKACAASGLCGSVTAE